MANSGTYNRTKVHFSEGAAAATPDAAEVVVYAKADGLMYSKDDAGTETLMSSGTGGGSGSITASGYTQNTARLLGRTTAAAGAIEEMTVGSGLSLAAGALTATGGAATGNVLIVTPHGFNPAATGTVSNASQAWAMPVSIPGQMLLRGFVIRVTTGAAGTTNTWGLYDYSSNPAACTELATGVGALASAAWLELAATGGPITVPAGNYMLLFRLSAATQPTIAQNQSAAAGTFNKSQNAYAWDTTPDLTAGWAATSVNPICYLHGDLDGSNQW